ncbi:10 kDa chaperonin 1, chloroplastic-like isoform X3 [Macadamia integrifolia]|uniref:10 kDa chaperonin 1, chloroplastic-like isoform X3 n=1 Tax=Macadamia integrifolia TaxID=60698 RepID=UPI001C4E7AF9|nr:10 kDa chaperonin 1, chloroplastic-like isoform X3 [Macadamia integrifolia]
MASAFITVAKPFSLNKTIPSFSNQRSPGLRKGALRINAVTTKWEPTKVVPQADRVLIRLEDLPENKGLVFDPVDTLRREVRVDYYYFWFSLLGYLLQQIRNQLVECCCLNQPSSLSAI